MPNNYQEREQGTQPGKDQNETDSDVISSRTFGDRPSPTGGSTSDYDDQYVGTEDLGEIDGDDDLSADSLLGNGEGDNDFDNIGRVGETESGRGGRS